MPEYPNNSSLQVEPNLAARLAAAKEDVWFRIGVLQSSMNDRERALNAFERVLAVNPNNVRAMTQAGAVLAKKECYQKAIVYLQRAISADSSYGEAWAVLAHCYVMSDELHKAYEAYQSALTHLKNPRDPNLWYGIGLLYDRYGSLDNALEAFLAVLWIAPDFERADEVCFCIGIIYKEQQKFDKALEYFNKVVVAASPPPPLTRADGWYQIGHVNELKRDIPAAFERYKQALAENPKHAKTLQNLGWLEHLHNQNSTEAIRLLKASSELDPGDGQTWYLLGRVHMELREFRQAYDAYQQAVYRDGRNATFWCSIGVLYYQMHQSRDAMDAYSRAIMLNPRVSEVWYDLGTLYESCNQNKDAIDAYRKAAELAPENTQITDRLKHLEATMRGVAPTQAMGVSGSQQVGNEPQQQQPSAQIRQQEISQMQSPHMQQAPPGLPQLSHPSQAPHAQANMAHSGPPPQMPPLTGASRMGSTMQELPAPPGPGKLLQSSQLPQQPGQQSLPPPMKPQQSQPPLPSQMLSASQSMPTNSGTVPHSSQNLAQQPPPMGPSGMPMPMRSQSMNMAPIPSMHHPGTVSVDSHGENASRPFPSDARGPMRGSLSAVPLPGIQASHMGVVPTHSQALSSQQQSSISQPSLGSRHQSDAMPMPRSSALSGNSLPALGSQHRQQGQPERPPQNGGMSGVDSSQQQSHIPHRSESSQQQTSPIPSVSNQTHSPRAPQPSDTLHQQSPHSSANKLPSMNQNSPGPPMSSTQQDSSAQQKQQSQQQPSLPSPAQRDHMQQESRPPMPPLPQLPSLTQLPHPANGEHKSGTPPMPGTAESQNAPNQQENRNDRPNFMQSDTLRRIDFEQTDTRNENVRMPKLMTSEGSENSPRTPSGNRDQQLPSSQPKYSSSQSVGAPRISGVVESIPSFRVQNLGDSSKPGGSHRSISTRNGGNQDQSESAKTLDHGTQEGQGISSDQGKARPPDRLPALNALPVPNSLRSTQMNNQNVDTRDDQKMLHSMPTPTLSLPSSSALAPISDSNSGRPFSSPEMSGPSPPVGSSALSSAPPTLPPLSTRNTSSLSGDGKDLPPTPSAPSSLGASSLTKFRKGIVRTPATPVNSSIPPSTLPSPLPTNKIATTTRTIHTARSPRLVKPHVPTSFKSVPPSSFGPQIESVPSPSSLPVLPVLSSRPIHGRDEQQGAKDKEKGQSEKNRDDNAPESRTREKVSKDSSEKPGKADEVLSNKPVFGMLRSVPMPQPDRERRDNGDRGERMRSPGHSSTGRMDGEKVYNSKRDSSPREDGRTAKRPRLADVHEKDNGPSSSGYEREERNLKGNDMGENRGNGSLKDRVTGIGKDERPPYKEMKSDIRRSGSPNSESERTSRRDSGGRKTDELSKEGNMSSQQVIDLPRLPTPMPKLSSPLRMGGNNGISANTPLPSFLGERLNLSASRNNASGSASKGSGTDGNRGSLAFLRSAPVSSVTSKSLSGSIRSGADRTDFGMKAVSEDKSDAGLSHVREESGKKHVANGEAQKSS